MILTMYLALAIIAAVFGYVVLTTWREGNACRRGSAEYWKLRVFFVTFLGIWIAGLYGAWYLVSLSWSKLWTPVFQ